MSAADVALLKPEENKRFRPEAGLSHTLPARYYYDPEIFEREKEAIFFRSWQYAGHVQDLPDVGSYITCEILDQNIFVIKGKDRQLRAFYNVCSHRANQLVKEKGRKKVITCPYHAWSYDTEGRLRSAPGSEDVEAFNPDECYLKGIQVEQFANLVFVNLDPNAQSLKSQAAPLEQEFYDAIPGFDDLKLIRSDPFEVKCNWKIAIENFVECYHCPNAHPTFMGRKSLARKETWINRSCGIYSSHKVRCGKPENVAYPFSPNDAIQDGFIWALWPNTLFMAWPGPSSWIVFQINPSGPETTKELMHFFGGEDPYGTMQGMIDYHSSDINDSDVEIIESVQRGAHSRGYNQGRLIVDRGNSWRSEHAIHQFQRLVWQALNGTA